MERLERVRPERNAGADIAQHRAALVDLDVDASLPEGNRRRQPADTGADHDRVHCSVQRVEGLVCHTIAPSALAREAQAVRNWMMWRVDDVALSESCGFRLQPEGCGCRRLCAALIRAPPVLAVRGRFRGPENRLASTLLRSLPRRVGMRVGDRCQAHRCAGGDVGSTRITETELAARNRRAGFPAPSCASPIRRTKRRLRRAWPAPDGPGRPAPARRGRGGERSGESKKDVVRRTPGPDARSAKGVASGFSRKAVAVSDPAPRRSRRAGTGRPRPAFWLEQEDVVTRIVGAEARCATVGGQWSCGLPQCSIRSTVGMSANTAPRSASAQCRPVIAGRPDPEHISTSFVSAKTGPSARLCAATRGCRMASAARSKTTWLRCQSTISRTTSSRSTGRSPRHTGDGRRCDGPVVRRDGSGNPAD